MYNLEEFPGVLTGSVFDFPSDKVRSFHQYFVQYSLCIGLLVEHPRIVLRFSPA